MKATIDTKKVTYETEIGTFTRSFSVDSYDDDIVVEFGEIDGSEIPETVSEELLVVVYAEIEANEVYDRHEIEADNGFDRWGQITVEEIELERKAKAMRAAFIEAVRKVA